MLRTLVTKGLAALVKFGFGDVVNRTFEYLEKKGEQANDREQIRADLTIEAAKTALEEVRIMADLNKAKFEYAWFWVFIGLFIVPLGFWWTAVIVDSVFGFTWNVADLPTVQMRTWAGDMIRWLFYVGTGVGAAKAMLK